MELFIQSLFLKLATKIVLVVLLLLPSFHSQAEWKIEGVNSEIEQNIRLHLEDVASPAGDFEVEQFATRIRQKITTALHAYSYYQAEIDLGDLATLAKSVGDSGKSNAQINIRLGEPLQVSQIIVNFDTHRAQEEHFPQQIQVLFQQLNAMKGKTFKQGDYEKIKSSIQSVALIFGYFDFEFPEHRVEVSTKTNTATLIWTLQFGQRYRFGSLSFVGDETGQELVNAVKPFKESDFFDQQLLGEFTQAIRQTGYYESALARANVAAMTPAQKQSLHVPVEVLLKTKPRDTYQFGVGVSTDSGPRVTVSWERPWVNLRGHSLSSELYVSAPKKTASLAYAIPMANPLNDFLNIQLGYQQLDEDQRESDTFSLALQRQFGAKNADDWNRIAFLRYEYEQFIQGSEEEQTTKLLIPGFSFNRTRKRGDLFIDWGDRQQIKIEGATQEVVSDIDLVRITAQTKWIRTFDSHRLILRAEAGGIFTSDFEQVPTSLRFFAGGDNSIRGFQLNSLSDSRIDEETGKLELIGARFLGVASSEYAYQLSDNWRAAAFVDVGSASDDFGKDLAYGVGIGAHWLSPVGTVRVYVARGISEDDKGWRLHLSIGPGL